MIHIYIHIHVGESSQSVKAPDNVKYEKKMLVCTCIYYPGDFSFPLRKEYGKHLLKRDNENDET